LITWQYQSQTDERDLRLDFLRGFLVFVMTINHLATFPAWTRVLTGGGRLWVSAAVGFVLISGIVLGFLYRQRVINNGWPWSIEQIGRRAFHLYILGAAGRLILASGDYVMWLLWDRRLTVPDNYWHILEGAVFQIHYHYGYVDLLPLYAVLLPVGLFAVYLLNRGKWPWLILASLSLWYAARTDPGVFNLWRIVFHPAIWQLPFFIGVIVGYYRAEIKQWRLKLPLPDKIVSLALISSSIAMLIISYRVAYHGLWADWEWVSIKNGFFTKSLMGPGRLIAAIWILAGLYELVGKYWKAWQGLLGWLFLPLGQNALIAYLVQAILSYVVTHLPGYPFPGHSPFIMGFWHITAVLLVWQFTKSITRIWGHHPIQLKNSPSKTKLVEK
jgi:hypothetical protein